MHCAEAIDSGLMTPQLIYKSPEAAAGAGAGGGTSVLRVRMRAGAVVAVGAVSLLSVRPGSDLMRQARLAAGGKTAEAAAAPATSAGAASAAAASAGTEGASACGAYSKSTSLLARSRLILRGRPTLFLVGVSAADSADDDADADEPEESEEVD